MSIRELIDTAFGDFDVRTKSLVKSTAIKNKVMLKYIVIVMATN